MHAKASARLAFLVAGLAAAGLVGACKSDEAPSPPVPASAHPEGKDLVEGAIVAAQEKEGGVRLYKIKKVTFFPPPLSEELVMIAFREKGSDFKHAARLFEQRDLTVALPNVRVYRHNFMTRDYRVLEVEPVSDAERALKADEKLPAEISPGEAKAAKSQ